MVPGRGRGALGRGALERNGAAQPVVCVTWWETEAFCRWAKCRLPTDPLDQRELPQRTGEVEAAHCLGADPVEQLAHTAVRGKADVPEVEIEVEGGVGLPAQHRRMQRHRPHLLAQGRHVVRDLLHTGTQA